LATKGEEEFRDAKKDYVKVRELISNFLQNALKEIDGLYESLREETKD